MTSCEGEGDGASDSEWSVSNLALESAKPLRPFRTTISLGGRDCVLRNCRCRFNHRQAQVKGKLMSSISRRGFLGASAVGVASTVFLNERAAKAAPNERIRVGCVGGGGRAGALVRTFSNSPNADVLAIADLDPERLGPALEASGEIQGRRPRAESDFRRLIDDDSLDAIVVGTPDHWHAIPTILACQAGKDVYVEKPDGHTS